MDIAEVEAKLVAACERAIAEGWRITPGLTVAMGTKRCCALGAIWVTGKPNISPIPFARSVLGCPVLATFVAGFDGGMQGSGDLYDLGARLRARYVTP